MSARGAGDEPPLRISVIIPAWRDAENLSLLLPKLAVIPGVTETIVVNASRETTTETIVRRHEATYLRLSPPNRGAQMNAGAAAATGDVLLFQHADTDLRAAHVAAMIRALQDRDVIGGAFHRKFDGWHPRVRHLERVGRFLSRHGGTLHGDQSVFVRRNVFERLGGFADFPLMEDVEFSKRLRRAPGVVVVLDPPVEASGRQQARKGTWRMAARKAFFLVLYKLGVSPVRLHRWHCPVPELPRRPRSSGPRADAASAKPAPQ